MLQIQQISSWRSMYGSEMGDPMVPQLLGGFDQTIPMTTIAQVKKPMFKKLLLPVCTFQVTPPARGILPAGLAASLLQMGVTAAAYVVTKKPAHMESPSLEMLERKRTEHQNRDPTKKVQSLTQRSN